MTGTYLATSYGWTDPNVLMPIHVSLTGRSDQTVGWNIYARQPLPSIGGMHMEMTVDLRNLLAQGYVGIQSGERQRRPDQRAARGAGRRQLHFLNRCIPATASVTASAIRAPSRESERARPAHSRRLLLRHAVQRSQPQNQIAAGDPDHGAIGEQVLQRTQRGASFLSPKVGTRTSSLAM